MTATGMSQTPTNNLYWWTSPRALLRAILMLDDTPHSIALGTAIGMFIGITPTVGIQMILVMLFAFLVRPLFHFNRVAAVLTVYISNPLTLVPIYWFNYGIGTLFVEGDWDRNDFAQFFNDRGAAEVWETLVELFVGVGTPLIVGSLVVATICSLVTYPAMLWLVRKWQKPSTPQATIEKRPVGSAAD